MNNYVLNTITNVIHIKGYCKDSNISETISGYKFFESEEEALAFGKIGSRMCILCQRKRDSVINNKN